MLIATFTAPYVSVNIQQVQASARHNICQPPQLSLSLSLSCSFSLAPSPISVEQYSTLKNASCHQVQSSLLYSTPKDLPPSQGKSNSGDDFWSLSQTYEIKSLCGCIDYSIEIWRWNPSDMMTCMLVWPSRLSLLIKSLNSCSIRACANSRQAAQRKRRSR